MQIISNPNQIKINIVHRQNVYIIRRSAFNYPVPLAGSDSCSSNILKYLILR
jgi:hypothetical protein